MIPDCLRDRFSCEDIMVVLREDRFGPRASHFGTFVDGTLKCVSFSDPKRPIIPGLSGFIPKVLSISSSVGDYKIFI